MRNFLAALAVVGLVFAANGQVVRAAETEQDAAHMAAARDLVQADGLYKVADQIIDTMSVSITDSIVKRNPEKEKEIRELMGEIFDEMKSSKKEMTEQVARIYAQHFTTEEINQLLAFRRTPVGKKMIEKMPVIMQQSLQLGQAWGQKLAISVMQRFQERAKSRGIDL